MTELYLQRRRVIVAPGVGKGHDRSDIGAIDRSWQRAAPLVSSQAPITIDLGPIRYMEHETLMFVAGTVRERALRGQETWIELPHNDRVISYLRAWNFPSLLSYAAHRPFISLLTERSRDRFEHSTNEPSKYLKVVDKPSGGRENLLPTTFFACTPVRLRDDPFSAASVVRSKWLDRHVVSILDRYLGNRGDNVATKVMHEAVLNAAGHPNAIVAFTSSQLDYRGHNQDRSQDDPVALQIAVWDDGDSFSRTLEMALERDLTIQSPAYGLVSERVNITLLHNGEDAGSTVLTSDDREIARAPIPLMVAAFLLGVTSLAVKGRARPHLDEETDSASSEDMLPLEARGHGGLGLALIRRTVIDTFGGELQYITGGYRIRIRGNIPFSVYDCTVDDRGDLGPVLRGNLLLANIPLGAV